MTTTPQQDLQSQEAKVDDAAVAARRHAILRGLGKGGVALAALSPLASQATRSFKVPNPELPAPSFGYCTVSGFQSAAISGNPAPVQCGAFEPSYFAALAVELDYNVLEVNYPHSNPSANANQKLAFALNGYYGSGLALTGPNIRDTLRKNPPSKLVISTTSVKAVIVPVPMAARKGTELRSTATFPTSVDPTQAFNAIFPSSSDTRTLLEVLQDGVASATPASANCYVLAAWLSVGLSGAVLPPSLNRAYIATQYTASSYGSGTNLYKFFRQLCVS